MQHANCSCVVNSMVWSSTQNLIHRRIQLSSSWCRTAKEFSTVKSLCCQGLFILWQQEMLGTISRKKSYPINVLLWSLRDFLLLWLLLSVKNLTSGRDWELKTNEFLFWAKSAPDTNVSCLLPLGPSGTSPAHNVDREVFSQKNLMAGRTVLIVRRFFERCATNRHIC